MEESSGNAGGQGGELCVRRSDVVLEKAAIKKRWPLSEEKRKQMADRAFNLFMNSTSERLIGATGKLLTAMEAQNQADEHLADKNNRLDDGKPTEIKRVYTVEFDE